MFDTEFDFTNVINNFNANINQLNAQKTLLTNKKSILENSTYNNLMQNEIDLYNIDINYINDNILGYQAIIDEIVRIQNLSIEDKNLIYYFYTVLGIHKKKYMLKLLFNTNALTDTNVLNVYNDVNSTNEVKLLVAQLLYNRFNIDTTYFQICEVESYL